MRSFFRKLRLATALVAICSASLAPTMSVAQTIGVGWDGYTRELWRYRQEAVSLWLFDPYLHLVTMSNYGPYGAWEPVALTTGNNNYSYLLWRYPGGIAAGWILDSNLNFVTSVQTGANPGWTPETISTGDSYTQLRLTWRRFDGMTSVWAMDSNLNYLWSAVAGPYAGWDSGPAPEAVMRKPASVQQLQAMSAMRTTLHVTAEMAQKRALAVQAASKAMAQLKATKAYPALPKL
jgi:hypothetical protein